jgi:hypothetical protein
MLHYVTLRKETMECHSGRAIVCEKNLLVPAASLFDRIAGGVRV